jgi:hypothetical protein
MGQEDEESRKRRCVFYGLAVIGRKNLCELPTMLHMQFASPQTWFAVLPYSLSIVQEEIWKPWEVEMRISDSEVVEMEKVVLSLHVQCEVTIPSLLEGSEPSKEP